MKITLLRKGSKGLVGTYENINHHAKNSLPVVNGLIGIIEKLSDNIKEWKQGVNTHVLTSYYNNRKLVLTPYLYEIDGDRRLWGVQISVYVSRGTRVPLMHVTTVNLPIAEQLIESFMCVGANHYGNKDE